MQDGRRMALANKKLSESKRRWPTHEKEMWVVIHYFKTWGHYIGSKDVVVWNLGLMLHSSPGIDPVNWLTIKLRAPFAAPVKVMPPNHFGMGPDSLFKLRSRLSNSFNRVIRLDPIEVIWLFSRHNELRFLRLPMESGRPPGNRLPVRKSSVNLTSLPTSAGMVGPLN